MSLARKPLRNPILSSSVGMLVSSVCVFFLSGLTFAVLAEPSGSLVKWSSPAFFVSRVRVTRMGCSCAAGVEVAGVPAGELVALVEGEARTTALILTGWRKTCTTLGMPLALWSMGSWVNVTWEELSSKVRFPSGLTEDKCPRSPSMGSRQ